MSWLHLALGCVAATALLGCHAAAPAEHAPPELRSPPPAAWRAADAARSDTPPETAWWQRFGDPVLSELVAEAQTYNHQLGAAVARLDAAAVQARLAGAALDPTLDLELDGARSKQNFIGLPIPGAGGGVLSRTFTRYGVALRTSWELDLWGRVRSAEAAALADVEAAAADLLAAQHSLAAQTAKAYFATLETELQIALAARTEQLYALTQERVEQRVRQGVNPALDLRLARSNLAASRAAGAAQDERAARARRQLELLLGRYPDGSLAVATDLPALPAPPPLGQPAELLRRRPDVRAAERRLAADAARTDAARAALFPRLSLTASAGTASQELEDLADPDFFVWNLAGNLLQPLWSGGRLRGEVALGEAAAREAAARYAQTALTAYGEVEAALAAEQFLRRREAELLRAETEAEAASTLAEDRYRRGLSDLLSVLDAQRRALDAARERITVRRLILDTRVDLHLALGGGFAPEPPSAQPGDRP